MILPFYTNESLKAYFEVASADRRALLDSKLFNTDPLTCKKEYLLLLALEAGVNIDGFSEGEQREMIANAFKSFNRAGTIGALKEALAHIGDMHVVEKRNYLFDVEVTLKADPTAIYTTKKFQTAKTLINDAKNVRSHLNSFEIKFPQSIGEIQTTNALNLKVGVSCKTNQTTTTTATIHAKSTASYSFDFKQDTNKYLKSDAKVSIKSVAVFTFALDQKTELKSSAISTNKFNGGAMWQI